MTCVPNVQGDLPYQCYISHKITLSSFAPSEEEVSCDVTSARHYLRGSYNSNLFEVRKFFFWVLVVLSECLFISCHFREYGVITFTKSRVISSASMLRVSDYTTLKRKTWPATYRPGAYRTPIFFEKFLKFGIVQKCLNFYIFKCHMSKTSASKPSGSVFFLCEMYANLRQLVVH